jgi:hypothetical protein
MRKARVRAFAARHAAELIAGSLPEPADFQGEGFTAEDRVAVYNELRLLAENLLADAERLDALR